MRPGLPKIIERLRAEGLDTDKIPSYLLSYEEFLGPLRDAPINFLEIGILGGGSIAMWHEYFSRAKIHGLDQSPSPGPGFDSYCKRHNLAERVSLHMGVKIPEHTAPSVERHQTFKRCFGKTQFDVILDDGAHTYTHTKAAFEVLFPEYLKPGGIYILEDWGTTYFPEWPDGSTAGDTGMFRLIKEACDEIAIADRMRNVAGVQSTIRSMVIRFGHVWLFKEDASTTMAAVDSGAHQS